MFRFKVATASHFMKWDIRKQALKAEFAFLPFVAILYTVDRLCLLYGSARIWQECNYNVGTLGVINEGAFALNSCQSFTLLHILLCALLHLHGWSVFGTALFCTLDKIFDPKTSQMFEDMPNKQPKEVYNKKSWPSCVYEHHSTV